jgi:hypothetical protein
MRKCPVFLKDVTDLKEIHKDDFIQIGVHRIKKPAKTTS